MLLPLFLLSMLFWLFFLFCNTKQRLMPTFLILQSIVLMSLLLIMFLMLKTMSSLFLLLLLLTLAVSEASLALSLLISYIKISGSDLIQTKSSKLN
uniref:NADH dehydrogenase subunit 4L n=1 Tax=Pinguiphaedusa platydera TaxID=318174 RepID=A0A224AAY8_9EUPU|nr:NADH dehydrogenase subunit 4L [Pinguiphaedusa platydera]